MGLYKSIMEIKKGEESMLTHVQQVCMIPSKYSLSRLRKHIKVFFRTIGFLKYYAYLYLFLFKNHSYQVIFIYE